MDSVAFTTKFPLLFERAAGFVGLDFLAHPFWDKYIEFEERQEAHDKIFAILTRVINIPMHQYARYFERFRHLSAARPLGELAPTDVLARFRAEVEAEAAPYGIQRSEPEIERDMRVKIDAMYYAVFQRTQTETNKRWTYESEIKRPYFHVTELEHPQLVNWRKYLDFEEAEGNYTRTVCLYERCMVTCALYDEFWFRYARWLSAQEDRAEEVRNAEVRNVFLRAATIFVPISRPGIRLQFAYFEEACGRPDVAADIHAAVLARLPDSVEVIVSWANLERRQLGLDAAIEVLRAQIDSPTVDLFTKAALVTEWALMLAKVKGSVDEARSVFLKNTLYYGDSLHFWRKWLDFELEQPTSEALEPQHAERVRHVFDELKTKSRVSTAAKKELAQVYLDYLQRRGGKGAMKQYLELDREMFGPTSVSVFSKLRPGKENGAPAPELDEATLLRAETRYYSFYQAYTEPDPAAQGPALFN